MLYFLSFPYQVKFTSYTGAKSLGENLAFLPTTIMRFENSTPVFAQWNYRILCHKLKTPVPLTKFRASEDLATRMKRKQTWESYVNSRSARFDLDRDLNEQVSEFREKETRRNFLDKLMEEVPGKNNYGDKMEDGGFDAKVLDFDGVKPLDVSRYHRWFKLLQKDAMGRQQSHRGYADMNMFAAKTTQDRVSGLKMKMCRKVAVPGKKYKKKICETRSEKWSYAVPLEIIYLTPLSKWNPYNIKYQPVCNSSQLNSDDKRIGTGVCKDMSRAKKFACDKFYYLTPSAFFSGKVGDSDPADTAKSSFCMLDKDGNGVAVAPTGTRIKFPMIEGVGALRQRFPISPIHGHGSAVWKNLNALSDMVMHNASYHFMKVNPKSGGDEVEYTFQLSTSQNPKVTPHEHYFTLSKTQYDFLKAKNRRGLRVETDTREGHSHSLVIRWNRERESLEYFKCGKKRGLCMDQRSKYIFRSYD